MKKIILSAVFLVSACGSVDVPNEKAVAVPSACDAGDREYCLDHKDDAQVKGISFYAEDFKMQEADKFFAYSGEFNKNSFVKESVAEHFANWAINGLKDWNITYRYDDAPDLTGRDREEIILGIRDDNIPHKLSVFYWNGLGCHEYALRNMRCGDDGKYIGVRASTLLPLEP